MADWNLIEVAAKFHLIAPSLLWDIQIPEVLYCKRSTVGYTEYYDWPPIIILVKSACVIEYGKENKKSSKF